MAEITVLSDEHSLSARLELIALLDSLQISVSDQGFLALRGASETEVLAALEWHLNQAVAEGQGQMLVLVSESGTSFSTYVNKHDGIRCLADSPLTDKREVVSLKANALEFRSDQIVRAQRLLRDLLT